MPQSAAYARVKSDVLRIKGRVATFKDIGAHLAVMPRHVAHILATLTQMERLAVPPGRVVAEAEAGARRIASAELPHGLPPA